MCIQNPFEVHVINKIGLPRFISGDNGVETTQFDLTFMIYLSRNAPIQTKDFCSLNIDY